VYEFIAPEYTRVGCNILDCIPSELVEPRLFLAECPFKGIGWARNLARLINDMTGRRNAEFIVLGKKPLGRTVCFDHSNEKYSSSRG
jgi:hypothetical protein